MVKHDLRYTVAEALCDTFFKNDQCLKDLQELETKIGNRWLTTMLISEESVEECPEDSNNNTN